MDAYCLQSQGKSKDKEQELITNKSSSEYKIRNMQSIQNLEKILQSRWQKTQKLMIIKTLERWLRMKRKEEKQLKISTVTESQKIRPNRYKKNSIRF